MQTGELQNLRVYSSPPLFQTLQHNCSLRTDTNQKPVDLAAYQFSTYFVHHEIHSFIHLHAMIALNTGTTSVNYRETIALLHFVSLIHCISTRSFCPSTSSSMCTCIRINYCLYVSSPLALLTYQPVHIHTLSGENLQLVIYT